MRAYTGEEASTMNGTEHDKSRQTSMKLTDLSEIQKAELDAAQLNLQADRSDLAQLLVHIRRKPVSNQQVPGLLKQAWTRLQTLRNSEPELATQLINDSELASFIEQAYAAVQPGDTFSLDNAGQAWQQAHTRCLETTSTIETGGTIDDNAAELAALLHSKQADIAALKQEYRQAADLYGEAAETPQLSVPLQWQYQTNRALTLETLGREFRETEALEQAIVLYETTIMALASDKQRCDDRATTQNNLGNALGILGQRQRATIMLKRSIAAFKSALSERDRQRLPLDWAATQNNLGNTFGILGQRQADTQMLAESIVAFEYALEERTRELSPQDWATTQSNLGAVLHTLGQQNKDSQMLKRAVDAYKDVLQEWTRERVPLDWATTMNNLATVLRLLGDQRKGPRTLEQSVAAYKNALAERTRERVPMDWAMTQNNLGAALQSLAERQQDTNLLKEAIAAYDNALKEWTHERMPIGWAMTMANVGVARRLLAEQTDNLDISRIAVANVAAAVDVFRNASHAQYTELGEEQLIKARALEQTLAGDTAGTTA